jgi:uncharacterized protein (DUF924 family)
VRAATALVFDPIAVAAYWRAAGPVRWFAADPRFDAQVRLRLGALHTAAASGALAGLDREPVPALAVLILLDQVPRNIFRGTAGAFATDAMALAAARRAIDRRFDGRIAWQMRQFFYLPLMHSEDLADQERCVALFTAAALPEGVRFAEIHCDVIRRFGRFPHRNAFLGRTPTPEEERYLAEGGFRA